ncbi:hypothetical protein K437DRAFT_220099 [Tilletiaria anomala UBC 951]|uniref:Uncharacterized protein n=1 Tax=Tilletiaria anomala (strain ATCC 24038 / CBS 436.72 / UBC 951) TaxID=1037660 RepID=A0A066WFB1_TILAU|nr:uncharacterized protein K437DRAFT_220099 [Tilletiaria anomala UBC 951]KDN52667.1 hypothetical protein K437DRAFT_220099 [Tilletiaria anomala UBC 951]
MDEARRAVRATLEEMELNFKLDPLSLGDRSDYNKGCAEIVGLLSRVRAHAPRGTSAGGSGRLAPNDGAADGKDIGKSTNKAAMKVGSTAIPTRSYETHDLLKAIDRKDVETIMAIRDSNFDLLLDLGGSSSANTNAKNYTPLGYAMSQGKEWEGICIVLTGALSRFVNQLPDPEEVDLSSHDAAKPATTGTSKAPRSLRRQLDARTMKRLRKVRANLKLAINGSLALEQTSLLASYCQVLNMSEGDMFIEKSIGAVQHALHARIVGGGSSISTDSIITSADPFAIARYAVLQYVTEALRSKKDRIAALEDFISNSVGDLILMSLWDAIRLQTPESSVLSETEQAAAIPDLAEPLPTYFFARDDRVSTSFVERVNGLAQALELVRAHSNVPKIKRHARMLNRANEVSQAFTESMHRLTSTERLNILHTVIMK